MQIEIHVACALISN